MQYWRWHAGARCAALGCCAAACGLVDARDPLPSVPRWILVDESNQFTLVRFDDPRQPRLEARSDLRNCCLWSPDGQSLLALGGTAETAFLGRAPGWQTTLLPAPESYSRAYFIGSEHLLARVSPADSASEEWVFRDLLGQATRRFGEGARVLGYSSGGGAAVLRSGELTFIRVGEPEATVQASAIDPDRVEVVYDSEGAHLLLATRLEDAIDLPGLPDFVAHVETEADVGCPPNDGVCRTVMGRAMPLGDSGVLVARATGPAEARLFVAPLGERVTLGLEPDSEGVLVSWELGNGDAWVHGPSGRVRRVVIGADGGAWAVEETNALEAMSGWQRIASGAGTVDPVHVDFDLIWLESDAGLSALDLSVGGEPNFLGSGIGRVFGVGRLAVLLGEPSAPIPCLEPCSYAGYLDPSDPTAPVLRGEFSAVAESDFAWAPDQSGLMLLSEGWLQYHAFATPNERYRLAPISGYAILREPPVW